MLDALGVVRLNDMNVFKFLRQQECDFTASPRHIVGTSNLVVTPVLGKVDVARDPRGSRGDGHSLRRHDRRLQ